MMDDSTLSAFLEIIRKSLFIFMCICGAYSVYCGNRAMRNLKTERGLMHKYWFIMTTIDVMFVPDYYTEKGNMFRVRGLISTIISLFAALAFGISFLF